jgi:hypothetical protein
MPTTNSECTCQPRKVVEAGAEFKIQCLGAHEWEWATTDIDEPPIINGHRAGPFATLSRADTGPGYVFVWMTENHRKEIFAVTMWRP